MDIVNPNYLNYMEQIQKNRKDIENLYDQELSDITQLNFKEDDANGLEYENGKATFYGKSTIIRDENTENLEVDSKVEIKISSGDENLIIDAGEDNSTLEIHFSNEVNNTLSRTLKTPLQAPTDVELVAVSENNSQMMIPFEDIYENVDRSEVIYDAYSDDGDINKGFTGGIQGGQSLNINFSKYKQLRVYTHFSTCNSYGIIDFRRTIDTFSGEYPYVSIITSISANNTTQVAFMTCLVNTAKNKINVIDVGLSNGSSVVDKKNNSTYVVYKIEGVY